MTEPTLNEINWRAAFLGFGVDWVFSNLVGLLVVSILLFIKGFGLESELPEALPPDVMLVSQIIGVCGALLGGGVAGYLAQKRGSLHGILGSAIGLFTVLCTVPILGSPLLNVGDLGFIVLNLIGAGYGGKLGEQWRARRTDKE